MSDMSFLTGGGEESEEFQGNMEKMVRDLIFPSAYGLIEAMAEDIPAEDIESVGEHYSSLKDAMTILLIGTTALEGPRKASDMCDRIIPMSLAIAYSAGLREGIMAAKEEDDES